jgi:hypothetical protein
MKINNNNFSVFLHTLETYEAQNGFGKNPKDFINQIIMRINKNSNNAPIDLLNIANDLTYFILNRNDVFNICNNNQYPFAYKIASVFSWGGMSGGKNASDLFFKNWGSYKLELEEILVEYSQNLITRNWAYERLNRMNLKGCGPAYFTKLLFYFGNGTSYIMDQWTSKSMELLSLERIGIHMIKNNTGHRVSNKNHSGIYEEFCNRVEILTIKTNQNLNTNLTPTEIEERIFSNGANGQSRGQWREFVVNNW